MSTKSKMIKRTLNYTPESLEDIKIIKDKFLNHRIVINDSNAMRIALRVAANASEETLLRANKEMPEVKVGVSYQ